jgi:AcrR family transcriptional regulator
MASRERRARTKQNLRREILDAARELFVAEGCRRVSMRKIAEKIEYSPTTIYLYLKDKTDLVQQICDQTFADLAQELTAIEQKRGNPLEKLRRGMRAYINLGLVNPSQYEFVFIAPITEGTESEYENSTGKAAFEILRSGVGPNARRPVFYGAAMWKSPVRLSGPAFTASPRCSSNTGTSP